VSRIRRVARNSIILGLQQVIVNLLSVFVVGYIARKLGKFDYGVFSLAFTFSVFFSFLGDLGLRTLTIREVARDRDQSNEYLGKIIPARLFLIFLMTAAIPLAAILSRYDSKTIAIVVIAALAAMFEQLSRIISDIFQAYEEMGKVAFRDISVRLFTGITSVVVLFYGYGLVAVSWIYVAGAFIGLIFNVVLYHNRFLWPKLQLNYFFIWTNVKGGLSFMVIGMASTLYARVDVFIISKLLDMQSVGIYNASANLFYRLGFIADAVATASFPAIAQLYWNERSEACNILSKSLGGILIIAIPTAVGGWILADEIILMIYGNAYASSSFVFKILIASVPFMFFSLQLNYAIGAIRLQNICLKIILLSLVIKIMLNIAIIPIYGVDGAAVTTFITESIGFVMFIYISIKHFELSGIINIVKILIVPTIVMGLSLYLVERFGLVTSILTGAITFFFMIFLVGKNEILKIYHVVKHGKQ